MTSTERIKAVMDILDKNDLCNNTINQNMFDTLKDNELTDENKINAILQKIHAYENYTENNSNKYPERIMYLLRQRKGLDKFDTSMDAKFNAYSSNEVFSEVCIWEGLVGGYDSTIKNWINDIYGIDLGVIQKGRQ